MSNYDSATPINIHLNRSIVIDLPGLGTAGYEWNYVCSDNKIISITHSYIAPGAGVAGGVGKEQFTVTGISKGQCSVSFTQSRSWEKNAVPFDKKTYLVTVS